VEVRGTNNSLVHPRGAVGVVTRTPTGDQKQFLVRFPDGFETSLTREKLEVLKHFKDRLPNGGPDSSFDLESLVIYRCVVGSRAYGLDNDESDTDRRGVYLAPAALREARVPVRVEADRERMLTVKRGEMPWDEVDAWRKELHDDFERALAETKLPERPDYDAANRFLIKARREMAKGFVFP